MADPSSFAAASNDEWLLDVEGFVNNIIEKAVQHAVEHENSPYIFASGVPGFGNSILGPRVPRVSVPSATLTMPAEHIDDSDQKVGNAFPSTGSPLPNDHRDSVPVDHHEPYSTQFAGKKRKLSLLEPDEEDRKSKRISHDFNRNTTYLEPSSPFHDNPAHYDDAEEEHETKEAELARLVYNFKNIIHPYTVLHRACGAVKPLQKVYGSLSSQDHTLFAVMSLIHDALEALRPLKDRQDVSIMDAEQILQRAGLESCLNEARTMARQTFIDIQNLEKLLAQCNEMPET